MRDRASMKLVVSMFIALVLMAGLPAIGFGDLPHQINYQGYLTDTDGNPVSERSLEMHFAVYPDPLFGFTLWSETQSVDVEDGVYNVLLGAVTPFPFGLFSGDRFLGITVGTDQEMSPRQRLASVPYAFAAEEADTLEGHVADDFALLDHHHDDRYNTKSEITAFLAGKSDAGHTHSGDEITSGTIADGYIAASIARDSELSAGLAGKADSVHSHSGNDITSGTVADARIAASITRDTELAAGLATKSDTGHAHDDSYYSKTYVDALENRIAALETLLAHFSRNNNEITISGANLHIHNGSGSTGGMVNGLGNLIVGYNELRGSGNDRTGSHNIVVGTMQNYSSYGGMVAGYHNTISGDYASVSGGGFNSAGGTAANVSGGANNIANGGYASVSGGGGPASTDGNVAFGHYTAILGGQKNIAGDPDQSNHMIGLQATVSGGRHNTASGDYASIVGGGGSNDYEGNIAFANYSAILGGRSNGTGDVSRNYSSGHWELVPGTDHTIGVGSSLSSGHLNIASGDYSSISGGQRNDAVGDYASVSGGQFNDASNEYASVSGGNYNTADGQFASVSGGCNNTADGQSASVSGGNYNTSDGSYSSVSGGGSNTASGDWASVSGGSNNTASGHEASVSGGFYRSVSGTYDWRAGSLFEDI